jgi:hypothetical protein
MSESNELDLTETVSVYIKIRDAIEELEEKHKAEVKELQSQFELVGNTLLEFCNTQNVDSVKTPAGTISRRVTSRYWTSDWDSLNRVILEHGALDLLEKRIHNGNMRTFLEENPEAFPPGLQLDSKYTVQVRRPTAK